MKKPLINIVVPTVHKMATSTTVKELMQDIDTANYVLGIAVKLNNAINSFSNGKCNASEKHLIVDYVRSRINTDLGTCGLCLKKALEKGKSSLSGETTLDKRKSD